MRMGVYDSNTVDEISSRVAGIGISGDGGGDGGEDLAHVMKAVEDAEITIRQQLEENNHLKDQLLQKTLELERVRFEATYHHQSASAGAQNRDSSIEHSANTRQYSENIKLNGLLKISGEQAADSGDPSQLSTASSRSLSPTRHQKGDLDPRSPAGLGSIQVAEISSNTLWKQDLITKVKEHEEEIAHLRKHLADYSVKEAQILNEKYVLEKRIAYMRNAFDQQQQDLVDAASKALSYRQEIIEENIRLTYALQAAHQERSTFISSLVPLLSEYGLQPAVLDAQLIVGNLKVLFKNLQEKLIITEEKLKEMRYQITPWRVDYSDNVNHTSQSPSHPLGKNLQGKNNLEIVAQPPYSNVQSPSVQSRGEWDIIGNENHRLDLNDVHKNVDHDNLGRISPPGSSNRIVADMPTRSNLGEPHVRFHLDSRDENPSFKDLVRGEEFEDSEGIATQHLQDSSAQWGPASSSNLTSGHDDANSSYPYLPTVLEEPSSSFSEAAEDDPLPAIEGLRITGDAYPGRELQASGYSINGTTSCNFEWVRHLEDGSVNYIESAKQPYYLVTADDVDSLLAVIVQPLDDRKRKGELVTVFANEQKKITCDPEMQEQIRRTHVAGHVSYEVLLSAKYMDLWEPAVLAIKREGYSIKCHARGVVVTEKFQQETNITIRVGLPSQFSIQSAEGFEYVLKTTENGPLRDTVVLTLRLFRSMAVEKRKGRKRGLFFTSK